MKVLEWSHRRLAIMRSKQTTEIQDEYKTNELK